MKKGFTLIEIVVVLTMMAIILASIVGALMSTFRANNKMSVTNKVTQNGNWALGEIRKNILNAKAVGMDCPMSGVGTSMAFVSTLDGDITVLKCTPPFGNQKGKISSESAREIINLTSIDEVNVSDCSNFVSCSPGTSPSVPGDVSFDFIISAGITSASNADYAQKEFNSKITIRN